MKFLKVYKQPFPLRTLGIQQVVEAENFSWQYGGFSYCKIEENMLLVEAVHRWMIIPSRLFSFTEPENKLLEMFFSTISYWRPAKSLEYNWPFRLFHQEATIGSGDICRNHRICCPNIPLEQNHCIGSDRAYYPIISYPIIPCALFKNSLL